VAEEASEGAQFPPEQGLVSDASPKKMQPFTFKPGHQDGKHWWWAHQPRRQALAGASAPGAGKSSKGKECLELAKRARSSGLKPGDRKLAQVCLKLAKGDEKASRQHVDTEIKARVQKKAHFNEKKQVGLMVGSKKVTLHLYRPKGFHEKLAHPKPGLLAQAQAREFGAVDPAFVRAANKPWWKRGGKGAAAQQAGYLSTDNTPLAVKQHMASNNVEWWKADTHYGYKAKEHKGAKLITPAKEHAE